MTDARRTGTFNAITDVAGLRVGHAHRTGRGWLTGTTVVLTPPGSVGSVDVRGGGPGTRETDLLDPSSLVQHVHAVCLSGGSAYGLAAADGVVDWLAAQGIGFPVGAEAHQVVPIVPAAVLFDLGRGGRFEHRPDASFGHRAARSARPGGVTQGSVGAGAGAAGGGLKGGLGTASEVLADGTVVGALVALNCSGSVLDPATGVLLAAGSGIGREFGPLRRPDAAEAAAWRAHRAEMLALNTTIGVVATDATLTKAECRRLAMAAHDGLARAVRPAHGLTDGDTFFALATGERPVDADDDAALFGAPGSRAGRLNLLLTAAADAVTRAIVRAVLSATSAGELRSFADWFPSAVGQAPARR